MTQTMPWGKHKGKTLDKVPRDYLTWLSDQDWFQKTNPAWLRNAVLDTLGVDYLSDDDASREFRAICGGSVATLKPAIQVMPRGKHKGTRLTDLTIESLDATISSYNGMNRNGEYAELLSALRIERTARKEKPKFKSSPKKKRDSKSNPVMLPPYASRQPIPSWAVVGGPGDLECPF